MSDYDGPSRQETGLVLKWGLWIIGLVFVFGCVGSVVGLAQGWLSLPGRILDPNVALTRWQYFYDTVSAEKGLDANIKQAAKTVDEFKVQNGEPSKWNFAQQDEYNREVTVRDGYITGYNANAQRYNAQMRDITRNFARPPDLPTCIPDWGTQDCAY